MPLAIYALDSPVGYQWRASKVFVTAVISMAMFSDTFLFSFIVPILPEMLEIRIGTNPAHTQILTSIILSMNATVSITIAPFIAHFADKTSEKTRLLVISSAINAIGTLLNAWPAKLPVLIIGRTIQTISGSLIWIIGMAILADTVGVGNLAKALGLTYMFVSAGFLSGPAVSGTLYKLVSYRFIWTVAFGVIAIGLILQLLVICPTNNDESTMTNNSLDGESAGSGETATDIDDGAENSPLLRPNSLATTTYQSLVSVEGNISLDRWKTAQPETQNAYYLMLRQSRVSTALAADILFAMILSSFETTIPLHVKSVFQWDSLHAGLLFLLLQLPSMVLVLPAGWVKDKIGMRYPVTIGFLLTAPSLWLLGVAGNESFPWSGTKKAAEAIYLTALVGLGVCRTLLLGFGGVEVMHGANAVEEEFPGIFGPNGGYSRSFSLSNITWKFGMFVGPLISGTLTDKFGYYYMNRFLGKIFSLVIAPSARVPFSSNVNVSADDNSNLVFNHSGIDIFDHSR